MPLRQPCPYVNRLLRVNRVFRRLCTNSLASHRVRAAQYVEVLHSILDAVAEAVGDYVGYQIDAGAQCVQIFDSWGGQLPPHMWEVWSKPYIQKVVDKAGEGRGPRRPFTPHIHRASTRPFFLRSTTKRNARVFSSVEP